MISPPFRACTLVGSSLLLLWVRVSPAPAVCFSDNFNRASDPMVDNSWTEVDESNLKSSIESNALKMAQSGWLPADPNDVQNTRIYRQATLGHSNIRLSGSLRMIHGPPGGPGHVPRVVVRSNGTRGFGEQVNPNTGCRSRSPCGTQIPAQGCWQGDGYGFAAPTGDLNFTPGGKIQIVDNGIELASVPFSFENDTTFQWEMIINGANHIEVRMWNPATESRPASPTVEFNNGGAPYTPTASGNNWQIEVQANNDDCGSSHTHTAIWDDFEVCSLDAVPLSQLFQDLLDTFEPLSPVVEPFENLNLETQTDLTTLFTQARETPETTDTRQFTLSKDILVRLIDRIISIVTFGQGPMLQFIIPACKPTLPLLPPLCSLPGDIKTFPGAVATSLYGADELVAALTTLPSFQLVTFDLSVEIENAGLELFQVGDQFVTDIILLGTTPSITLLTVQQATDTEDTNTVLFHVEVVAPIVDQPLATRAPALSTWSYLVLCVAFLCAAFFAIRRRSLLP